MLDFYGLFEFYNRLYRIKSKEKTAYGIFYGTRRYDRRRNRQRILGGSRRKALVLRKIFTFSEASSENHILSKHINRAPLKTRCAQIA